MRVVYDLNCNIYNVLAVDWDYWFMEDLTAQKIQFQFGSKMPIPCDIYHYLASCFISLSNLSISSSIIKLLFDLKKIEPQRIFIILSIFQCKKSFTSWMGGSFWFSW